MAETITVVPSNSNTAAAAASAATNDDDRKHLTLEELTEFFRFKKGRDSPSEARNALLVIAGLITTATYQAVLSPPGGLWQQNGTNGEVAGKTIIGTNTVDYRFGLFLASNSAGFYGSLFLIQILTDGFPSRLELYFIMLALVISYDVAMVTIIPQGNLSKLFSYISIFLPLAIVCAAQIARKRWLRSCRGRRGVARLSETMTSSGP